MTIFKFVHTNINSKFIKFHTYLIFDKKEFTHFALQINERINEQGVEHSNEKNIYSSTYTY
jgi:hypothetical protein